MDLDANYRLIDRIDVSGLKGFVERTLSPYFDHNCRAWEEVRERSRWIGRVDRPANVAFRRMRPVGYMQLCVLNDEDPFSPWALPLPDGILNPELDDLLASIPSLLERHYGPGQLYFSVFAILAPGGSVPPHVDMPHDVNKKRYSHHLHIPLTASASTEFTVGEEAFVMDEGGVYEINNMRVHAVVNRGNDYRVNLMLDYCPSGSLARRNSRSPALITGDLRKANHVV